MESKIQNKELQTRLYLNNIFTIRYENPELDDDIGIIFDEHTTPQTSLTLEEFTEYYRLLTSKNFPIISSGCAQVTITDYLLSVPNIVGYCDKDYSIRFFYKRDDDFHSPLFRDVGE